MRESAQTKGWESAPDVDQGMDQVRAATSATKRVTPVAAASEVVRMPEYLVDYTVFIELPKLNRKRDCCRNRNHSTRKKRARIRSAAQLFCVRFFRAQVRW